MLLSFRYTLSITVLLFVTACTASLAPCNEGDPNSLCLSPLKRVNTHQVDAVVRRGGSGGARGGGGGSRGGGSRGSGSRATGSRGGGASRARPSRGSGSRPFRRPFRRPSGLGGDDDDDDFLPLGDDDEDDEDDDDDDDDDDVCFPASAVVTTLDRGAIRISQLQLGDKVLVAKVGTNSTYSTVFTFSHRIDHSWFPFKSIETEEGTLVVSAGHYVYTRDTLRAAKTLRPNDELQLADGSFTPVQRVHNVWEKGLYNPHTELGELLVDGFRVSSYTTSVRTNVATALLAPVRAAFALLRVDITAGLFEHSVHSWITRWVPKGANTVSL
ncbi:Sonic hedgehog protein A [Gracilariopsis chorda]|uniref:Sonic hedgehog protein A n=1 Tax=Gracilariopsis chorda TaxID=448386 RepID=A0A2V3IGM3_9FLOR|nr:Sonic hedgehog protein A [Gracilariopsis chorda]|eukprot:PXF41231.1 Sonic hedgehog protein A [Gracilariopsis chorda]